MPENEESRRKGKGGKQTEKLSGNDLWVRGGRMFGDLEDDEGVNANGLERAGYTATKNQFDSPEVQAGNRDLQSHDCGCWVVVKSGGRDIYRR